MDKSFLGTMGAVGRRHALATAVILLAACVFFWPFLGEGKRFVAADTLSSYYPWRATAPPGFRPHNTLITDPVNHNWAELYNRQLKEGDLQNWNPHFLTGVPATGATAMSGMSGRYYPLKLLVHRFLDTATAHSLLLFLHVLIMGVGMYVFLGALGAAPAGRLFGAIAWMFNGCAMVWLEFETTAAVSAYLPFLMLCLERLRTTGRPAWGAAGGVALGLLTISGHLQYLIYTSLLVGGYAAFSLSGALRAGGGRPAALRIIGGYALAGALGLLIGAVDLVPLAELVRTSGRIDRAFQFGSFFETLGRVPFRYYVTLLFPDWFGSPPLGVNVVPRLPMQEYMNYCELGLYAGVATLFGFLACLAAGARGARGFFLLAAAVSAALMSGTILYFPFFHLVPGMNRMNPTRIVWLFDFSLAVAAGLGVGGLADLAPRRRRWFLAGTAVLAAAIVALALLARRPGLITWFNAEAFRQGGGASLLAGLQQLRALSGPVILKPLLLGLAAAALFAWLALAPSRRQAVAACALLIALTAYDLISFGRGYNTVVPREQVYPSTPGIAALQRQPGPFRVLLDIYRGLYFNTMAPFGIQEVGGYSSFYPKRTNELASAIEFGGTALRGRRLDRWVSFQNIGSPLMDLMNVRYVLTAPGVTLPLPHLRPVYRGEMTIYENARALPRAFVVHRHRLAQDGAQALATVIGPDFAPAAEVVLEEAPERAFLEGVRAPAVPSTATVESYRPDTVRVAASLEAAGWLVLSDAWYPGWRVLVDGREGRLLRGDFNFRAVALPAGRHTVVFSFAPRSYRWGLALSALGAVLACGAMSAPWVLTRIRGRR